MEENPGGNFLHYMTNLPFQILQTGIIELRGNDFELQMKYDPDNFIGSIEEMFIQDPKLAGAVGNKASRLVFESKGNSLSGKVNFEVVEVN